jgi:hypothetical protein
MGAGTSAGRGPAGIFNCYHPSAEPHGPAIRVGAKRPGAERACAKPAGEERSG